MKKLLYVIAMRNNAYYRVGPFANKEDMVAWGNHEFENGDDPRWQAVELNADNMHPKILNAEEHPPQDENFILSVEEF